jgi:DNA-binding NarL/FixJ family response regulator
MTVRLIVVDDHAIVRRGIVQVLSEHPDVQIELVADEWEN